MSTPIRTLLAGLALLLLSACGTPPQKPMDLNAGALSTKSARVGVVMAPLPKVDTTFPGAGCLLCYAAASVANSSLTAHAQTLPSDDLVKIKSDLAELLRKKGLDAVVIDETVKVGDLPDFAGKAPDYARKDFSQLQTKYKLDKLLVIDIGEVGISRNYASYVPTGAPTGVVRGAGYLVNLKDNSLEWYVPLQEAKGTVNWDEPPRFPGLSNAYFQALEAARDTLLKPFM